MTLEEEYAEKLVEAFKTGSIEKIEEVRKEIRKALIKERIESYYHHTVDYTRAYDKLGGEPLAKGTEETK